MILTYTIPKYMAKSKKDHKIEKYKDHRKG